MTLGDVLDIPPHVIARQVGDETVLLDLNRGTYFGLDPIGARIWELICQNLTLAAISDVIVEEYNVSREIIEKDLLKLAEDLAAQKLVQVRE